MIDLADKPDLRALAQLIGNLRDAFPQADCLLVGAMARDVLLTHRHGIELNRATTDVDIAFAVNDWATFRRLREALLASGKFIAGRTLHRLNYQPLSISIDLIPFAGVEDADGNIAWPPENVDVMRVVGYREARASALTINLPLEQQLAVISLPMLVVLKVFAWTDRRLTAPRKDARDIDMILRNYLDAGNEERLYAEALHLLDAPNYDYALAGAWMCGNDARHTLDLYSHRTSDLIIALNAMLTKESNADGPLHYVGDVQSTDPEKTLKLLAAFAAGLNLQPAP